MKKYFINILYCLIFFAFSSCKSGDEEPLQKKTHILGHRGSGATTLSEFQENTFESVRNAFDKLDGAEADVQCSRDGTLWLFHDANFPDEDLLCIPQASDEQIVLFVESNPSFTLSTLEDIFSLMMEMENKPYLSLDVKGHFNNGCFENTEELHAYFQLMSDGLNTLLSKYPLHKQVMVETDYQYFLDLMVKSQPKIETYLLGYNNFEKRIQTALEKSYDGISFNFKDENLSIMDIQLAHTNNLKVQLWTVYNEDDFSRLMEWEPDFIQTGNVALGEIFMNPEANK